MRKFRVINNRKRRLRTFAARRFVTVSFIVAIFVVAGFTLYTDRIGRLARATELLESYEAEHANILLRQGFYLNEIIRLEDDDYIAMLAREQYFRSLPHEMVFIIGEMVTDEEIEEVEGN